MPLVVSGSEDWVYRTCKSFLAGLPDDVMLFQTGKTLFCDSASLVAHPSKLLGVEADGFILNAFDGFNPDLFGLAAGVVRAGGFFILLAPDFLSWPDYADPDYVRMAVYPHEATAIQGRFIARFARETGLARGVFHINERRGWVTDPKVLLRDAVDSQTVQEVESSAPKNWRSEQSHLVEKLVNLSSGQIVVLTADRGRGKTSALGLTAGEILKKRVGSTIVVTAPLRVNVDPLFRFAQASLGLDDRKANDIRLTNGGILSFYPPDELLRVNPTCDLLLVDEAAAIPPAVLMRLVQQYKNIIFSTTVYGYEGCGRGFEIRFLDALKTERPGWLHETLNLPVRWGEQDPLEGWVFRSLMLRPIQMLEPVVPSPENHRQNLPIKKLLLAKDGGELAVRKVDQLELLGNEQLLSDIFYLLVDAHYRTSPSDLRDLLDGLNFSVWVAQTPTDVLGVLLIAEEGGLDDAIMAQIYEGKRRPRGHVLPQAIVAQLGVTGVKSHFARVVRIAVNPLVRRRGVAAQLLDAAEGHYETKKFDYMGSMFGASAGLIQFWGKLGFLPVRLGYSKQASSGEYSVMVLKPLQPETAIIRPCLTLG